MHPFLPTIVLATTFLATSTLALPQPHPHASTLLSHAVSIDQSPSDNLGTPDGSTSGWKRDTTSLPAINPATHGIANIQAFNTALSKTTPHNYTAQRQTADAAPKAAILSGAGADGGSDGSGADASVGGSSMGIKRIRRRRAGSSNFDNPAAEAAKEERKKRSVDHVKEVVLGGPGRERKGRRDCIQPVMDTNGMFNYTVAAGSDVC